MLILSTRRRSSVHIPIYDDEEPSKIHISLTKTCFITLYVALEVRGETLDIKDSNVLTINYQTVVKYPSLYLLLRISLCGQDEIDALNDSCEQ